MSSTSKRNRIYDRDGGYVGAARAILRGKWSIPILRVMCDGPVRLGQLTRLIPAASKKVILENLKSLEAAGIIVRNDFSQRVLHVEYDLNERVKETTCQLLDNFATWAEMCVDNSAQPLAHPKIASEDNDDT